MCRRVPSRPLDPEVAVRRPALGSAIISGSCSGGSGRTVLRRRAAQSVAHSSAGISPVSSKRMPSSCLGRLVVEDQRAVGVDDEHRHGEGARELPDEDDLDRLLRHRSGSPPGLVYDRADRRVNEPCARRVPPPAWSLDVLASSPSAQLARVLHTGTDRAGSSTYERPFLRLFVAGQRWAHPARRVVRRRPRSRSAGALRRAGRGRGPSRATGRPPARDAERRRTANVERFSASRSRRGDIDGLARDLRDEVEVVHHQTGTTYGRRALVTTSASTRATRSCSPTPARACHGDGSLGRGVERIDRPRARGGHDRCAHGMHRPSQSPPLERPREGRVPRAVARPARARHRVRAQRRPARGRRAATHRPAPRDAERRQRRDGAHRRSTGRRRPGRLRRGGPSRLLGGQPPDRSDLRARGDAALGGAVPPPARRPRGRTSTVWRFATRQLAGDHLGDALVRLYERHSRRDPGRDSENRGRAVFGMGPAQQRRRSRRRGLRSTSQTWSAFATVRGRSSKME